VPGGVVAEVTNWTPDPGPTLEVGRPETVNVVPALL